MIALIRKLPNGRRAVPCDIKKAEEMVAAGKAVRINRALYRELSDDEMEAVPEETPVYQTKVMTADEPKRRGRPPKKIVEELADEPTGENPDGA